MPTAKLVISRAGLYMVTVAADPAITDPDEVRLYRNRTRVLLTPPMGATHAFSATFLAHDHDLLEASVADGSAVDLRATPCHASPDAPRTTIRATTMPTPTAPSVPSTTPTPPSSTPPSTPAPKPSLPTSPSISPNTPSSTPTATEGTTIRETVGFTGAAKRDTDDETRTLRE